MRIEESVICILFDGWIVLTNVMMEAEGRVTNVMMEAEGRVTNVMMEAEAMSSLIFSCKDEGRKLQCCQRAWQQLSVLPQKSN